MSTREMEQAVGEAESVSALGHRLEAAGILLVAVVLLAGSWWLAPSPAGHGTHEQLVPVPCGFHWITRVPCAMCGMTTAFALMARGEVLAAFGAHVLGPVLYLATVLMGGRAGYALLRGRPPLPGWMLSSRVAQWVLVVLGLGWGANVVLAFFA